MLNKKDIPSLNYHCDHLLFGVPDCCHCSYSLVMSSSTKSEKDNHSNHKRGLSPSMHQVCEGQSAAKKKRLHAVSDKEDTFVVDPKIIQEMDVWLPIIGGYLDAKAVSKFVTLSFI